MNIAIIDYGSGNLRSAANAFAVVAHKSSDRVVITSDPEYLAKADKLVLPGVGAFADCMQGLENLTGMKESLEEQVVVRGKPFLGICVGLQLTADIGLEYGRRAGFGWIPGKVVKINPNHGSQKRPLKVPHMGWNRLLITGSGHPLFNGIDEGSYLYFVHSFHLEVQNKQHRLAVAEYGQTLTAAAGRDNIVGTQFHPEKSQWAGLKIIDNFLAWRP